MVRAKDPHGRILVVLDRNDNNNNNNNNNNNDRAYWFQYFRTKRGFAC
jgi:hypothetical protein